MAFQGRRNVTTVFPPRRFSPGVRRPPEPDQRSGANVHYTLLIACVLVAFFLGAILSGFLVSCYCGGSAAQRARRMAKEPEAPLPHALSLRSLAKLNGLLDAPPKVMMRMFHRKRRKDRKTT